MMCKVLKVCFLMILFLVAKAGAQTSNKDSLVKAAAHKDAEKFKLSKNDYKLFLKTKPDSSSYLFKPRETDVADITLITDSVYTAAFRSAAYQHTVNRQRRGQHGNPYLFSLLAGAITLAAFAGMSALVRKIF